MNTQFGYAIADGVAIPEIPFFQSENTGRNKVFASFIFELIKPFYEHIRFARSHTINVNYSSQIVKQPTLCTVVNQFTCFVYRQKP